MDELEAHYLVKWEREALVMQHVLTAILQSRGHEGIDEDSYSWLGKTWVKED